MDQLIFIIDFALNLVGRIPGTFWGVAIGAIFSLAGVCLTNRAGAERLRIQLENDRTLRIAEREHGIRKEIYLEAVEGISACIISFGKFAVPTVPMEELSNVTTDKMPKVTRVQLIAGPDLLRNMRALEIEFLAAFQRLITKRIPLTVLQKTIEIHEAEVITFGKGRDEMFDLMKQFYPGDDTDTKRWDAIVHGHNFDAERASKAATLVAQFCYDLSEMQMVFLGDLTTETQALGRIAIRVTIAARKELGMPIDEADFIQQLEDGYARQLADLEKFKVAITIERQRFATADHPPESVESN